jgi:methylated-DNA-[protein]-cysteine S-methyltransferase
MPTEILWIDRVPSPIGELLVVTDERSLVALEFDDTEARMTPHIARYFTGAAVIPQSDPLGMCSRLRGYLAGDLEAFDGAAVDPGGDGFQRRVWLALRDIPPGETISYGALATRLGNPKASRAVGMANSRNPIAIVLPCHRVIGANGTLTGYAGGLHRKTWLLQHEGAAPKALI